MRRELGILNEGGSRHALADSPSGTSCSRYAPIASRTCRRLPKARAAFPVRQPDVGPVQAGCARRHYAAFLFPAHFGRTWMFLRLHDRPVHKAGAQPGFVVVLEQIPTTRASTARHASSCSTCSAMRPTSGVNARYRSDVSILVARSQEQGSWERANETTQGAADGAGATDAQERCDASFGMNMPMMSSAFDTAMWLTAA